jgi:hypothetical protein
VKRLRSLKHAGNNISHVQKSAKDVPLYAMHLISMV